jgi:hypothetical protein
MQTHRPLLVLAAVLAAALLSSSRVSAQAPAAETSTPPTAGGYDVQGSVSLGYRFTHVSGYTPMYRELYDLSSGVRIPEFDLFARAPHGSDLFADSVSISASGLGGDPYSTVQFTIRKARRYDVRASFRQSTFFWDRSDATLPIGLNGLTSNHAWDTQRRLGSVDLLLNASSHLRIAFEAYHASRSGMNLTTRVVDYFAAPDAWGFFARANPYTILAPLEESANRYMGGFDYTRGRWNVHYRAGYQIFDDAVTANNVTSPELSINADDPATAREALLSGSYQDYRRLTTPASEFSYDGRLTRRVEWRGGYTFCRYRGPAGLQAAYDGSARVNTTGSVVAPYVLSLDTRSQVTEPTHVIDQGVTWEAAEWLSVLADYRNEQIAIDGTADFTTIFNGALQTGISTNQWRDHRHQIDADLEFMPRADLLIRAGVRYLHRAVRVLEDGVLDDTRSKQINTAWPTVSASWKPNAIFNLRADVDTISNDVSYTRLTPQTTVGSRVMATLRPAEALSIVDAVTVQHQTLDAADYVADLRGNAATAHYRLSDRLSLFGGYTYDGFNATASTTFLRGTPPLTVVLADHTTNHVWQAGVSVKPIARLTIDASGNYIRTTGEGTITGEPPRHGPLTYPYATGTAAYEFPGLGQLAIDVTRTYYIESLTPLNNFGARIVMIRWTRGF